jgi:two-component system chemotaxis response regulator CheB
MLTKRKIRVLIVDDSILFRQILSKGLSFDPLIEVIATANDPFDARDKIIKYKPNVMTCDIQMPKMNGIEFIRRLMPQYPLPIIVVSTVSGAIFDAMNAGAIDFIGKPNITSTEGMEDFFNELVDKIKIAATANIPYIKNENALNKPFGNTQVYGHEIIAIGASTGGIEGIFNILKNLTENIPGILIVQHIPSGFSHMFAERLDALTKFKVKEAKTGDYVKEGQVLLAPGGKHMKVKKTSIGYKVTCFEGNKISGHCPSVDVLFESVAEEAGQKAIGIILTGMGKDGAKGLLLMKQRGAITIGQDESTAVVYGMPKAAYDIGAVDSQVPIENIPKLLHSIIKGRQHYG